MVLNTNKLHEKYDLMEINIHGSTQISNRVSTITAKLSAQDASSAVKPSIITLKAQARIASKLISIAEIAKRELTSKGIKVFQYNALSSEVIEIDRFAEGKGNNPVNTEDDDEASEEAFETMGPMYSQKKKRAMPLMTTYLSAVSIRELENEYSEQM